MSNNNFKPELSLLYEAAFGLRGKFIAFPGAANSLAKQQKPDANFSGAANALAKRELPDMAFSNLQFVDAEDVEMTSYLGTPVMFPITFLGGGYQSMNRNGEPYTQQMGDFLLPIATVVDFVRPTNMVRTAVNGNGTIKEYYGKADWEITFRGFCLNDPGHPQAQHFLDQHDELVKWDGLHDSIAVQGELFERKGISHIAIDKIEFRAQVGKHTIMPYEIKAYSDIPQQLILT